MIENRVEKHFVELEQQNPRHGYQQRPTEPKIIFIAPIQQEVNIWAQFMWLLVTLVTVISVTVIMGLILN